MSDVPAPEVTSNSLQDPLPDASWLFRRLFVFVGVGIVLGLMWYIDTTIGRVAVLSPERGIAALLTALKWHISLAGGLAFCYLIAPSAEQVTKLVQVSSLLKSGVQMASRMVQTPEKTETATTTGQPPQPIAPPINPEAPVEQFAPDDTSLSDGPPWEGTKP